MATLVVPPTSIDAIVRDIRRARASVAAQVDSAPADAQAPMRELLEVPDNLLDPGVVEALREPSSDPEQRAARNAWLRWTQNYWEALRGVESSLEQAASTGPARS